MEHKNRTGDNKFNMSLCIDIFVQYNGVQYKFVSVISDTELVGLEGGA